MLSNLKAYNYFFIHIGVLLIVYLCLYLLGFIEVIPMNSNLVQWDAGWYKSIVDDGYSFQESVQSNTGFFPFFPFLWKSLGFSNIGISLFNLLLFFTGVLLISKTIPNINKNVILLSLSFPSLFFMYVPYSEALFFFTASLYLYGNYKSNNYLKIFAVLLSSLARPTIFFFLPALIFSEFLSSTKAVDKVKAIIGYSIFILLGTFISFYFIGQSSNNFFAYSDSQINNWNHSFTLPSFPLTTWRGYRILWLDVFGLWIVISALIGSGIYFIKALKSRMKLIFDKNLLLSLSYLSMILVYVLFFHPKENSTGLTSILSLNRYVFCSPFVFYVLYYYTHNSKIKINKVLLISLIISLLLIGFPFQEIVGLTYFKSVVFTLGILAFLFIQSMPKLTRVNFVYLSVYLINITLQVYLFQSFLKGNWIG